MLFIIKGTSKCGITVMETSSPSKASKAYETLCDTGCYYDVNVCNADTGEVIASQTIVESPSGTTITQWVAK